MRNVTEAVKGSSWEDVLYPEPVAIEDRRAVKQFHNQLDSFAECINETLQMIESGKIPADVNYALRIRIRDIKEMIAVTDIEHRHPLLKKLMELHGDVFRNIQQAAEQNENDDGPGAA